MGLPSIDGAVRQNYAHRGTTLQELDNLLGEYNLKRDLLEINRKAPQWSHNAVWNKKYMEPKPGFTLQQLWANSESAIAQKTSPSYEVRDSDIHRAVTALAAVPAATLPDSAFLSALGTPAARMVPQTESLAQRAIEEWERNLCENKAVAILERMQAGRPALIKKDGGEMLIAIVLDRPLAEAKALVEAPNAFIQAITRIMQDKRNHPVIAQMITPEVEEDPTPSERAASSSGGHSHRGAVTPPHCAAKHTIPVNACGQREVLTVVTFFSLEYGRCRTVARSLHEHKQVKPQFVQGPKRSGNAGKSQQTKQHIKPARRSANPPARLAFRQEKQQTRQTKGAGAQTKTPTKKICQRTQWFDHCIIPKNMRKLIKTTTFKRQEGLKQFACQLWHEMYRSCT